MSRVALTEIEPASGPPSGILATTLLLSGSIPHSAPGTATGAQTAPAPTATAAGPEPVATGTLAATAVCAWAGARVYRVHEVVETRHTVDMVNSIAGRRPPQRAIRGLQ